MGYKKILLVAATCILQTASFLLAGTNLNKLKQINYEGVFIQPDSSQTNTSVDNSGIKHAAVKADTLSTTPTLSEINKLFLFTTQGKRDPFKIVSLVASKKDNAIPALMKFLYQLPESTKDTTLSGIKNPNKQYAIYALESIGSQNAENALITIVQTHPDIEIRGLALRMLANNFYYRTKSEEEQGISKGLQPDREIVHLMVENADDTTYVQSCSKMMGEIARTGIKNWTGKDYGNILPDSLRIKEEKKLGMTIKEYREEMWQKNMDNIYWNKSDNRFTNAK